MAKIRFAKSHALGARSVKDRIAGLEDKLKSRFGVSLAWREDQATVKGPGVDGSITVGEAEVAVELRLGLMLRPMAGPIEEAMRRQIDRALA